MSLAGFIPISLATLHPVEFLGMDLYVHPHGSERPILFCASTLPIKAGDLGRLKESGISRLYIRREARRQYQQFLREHFEEWIKDGSLPLSMRAEALNEVVRDVLSEVFAEGKTDPIVGVARAMGTHAVQLLAAAPIVFKDFIRVLHHDYATFTHSANVCYYSVLLATALGMSQRELVEIAVGGLLHDLGKLEVDPRILLKEGPLEERERRQIRQHPTFGFRQLCRRQDLSQGQLMMVYQHHERIDGRGYPVGIASSQIHPWARLCTIADVFEALTSNRPYRRALSLEGALQIMTKNNGEAFDPEMLECWTTIVTNHSHN